MRDSLDVIRTRPTNTRDDLLKRRPRHDDDAVLSEEVKHAYMELQLEMRQKYMGELLTIERLCIQLNVLQKGNAHLARLREMHLKHIHPLINRLRAPKKEVVRSELMWLVKMSKLLPPFMEEFMTCLKAMRQRSRRNMHHLLNERVAAAAA